MLGLLLFFRHINDLSSVVSSKVSLADKCLIYRNIKNKQDQTSPKNMLKEMG